MYRNYVADYSIHYRYREVRQILEYLVTSTPLTIFSPSGFGKSFLLHYISYNLKFRRKYRKQLKNLRFIYIDTTELVSEVQSFFQSKSMQVELSETIGMTLNNLIEKKLLNSIRSHGINIRDEDNLVYSLDQLFSDNRKLRLVIILDGFDQMYGGEFKSVRDFLKFTRDKYRGHIEYIFALSNANSLNSKYYNELGAISALVFQKIYYLPLEQNNAEFMHTVMLPMNRFIRRFYNFINPKYKEFLKQIDNLTGGYSPYTKFFIRSGINNFNSGNISSIELDAASKRLLNSLTMGQIDLLSAIANKFKVPKDSQDYSALKSLGIIQEIGPEVKLFSPILTEYLVRHQKFISNEA